MTPHDLVANFEVLAEAPNGVQRLRELVLELAVRGKLVKQDPADGTAQQQFPDFNYVRSSVATPRRGRQLKGSEFPEAAPEDLPENCLWVPIGKLMDLYNGRAFKPGEWSNTGVPIIRIQNLNDPSAPFNYCDFEVPEKFHVKDGDLLISWSGTPGTSFGAFIWDRGGAVLNQHIFRVELRHSSLFPKYIQTAVNARLDEMISRAHGGVGLRHITKGELEAIGIPIPPEGEQHRIVARVDELMTLLDRLEAQRNEREAFRAAARDSALAALREAPTPEDVEAAWLRVQESFNDLFAAPGDVEPLRELIRKLAVRGRLVFQDPDEEPASKLLERIQANFRKLSIKGGVGGRDQEIKRRKTLEEFPRANDLPHAWRLVILSDLLENMDAGWSPACAAQPTTNESEWGVLKTTAVQINSYQPQHHKALPSSLEPRPSFEVEPGDLLVTRAGPWFRVGVCCYVTSTRPRLMLSDKIIRCRFPNENIDGRWLALCINSGMASAYLRSKQTGMDLAQVNISQSRLASTPIEIPPLAEQHRIIDRMDKIMSIIDLLEAKQKEKEMLCGQFAAGSIHHLDA